MTQPGRWSCRLTLVLPLLGCVTLANFSEPRSGPRLPIRGTPLQRARPPQLLSLIPAAAGQGNGAGKVACAPVQIQCSPRVSDYGTEEERQPAKQWNCPSSSLPQRVRQEEEVLLVLVDLHSLWSALSLVLVLLRKCICQIFLNGVSCSWLPSSTLLLLTSRVAVKQLRSFGLTFPVPLQAALPGSPASGFPGQWLLLTVLVSFPLFFPCLLPSSLSLFSISY